MIYSHIVDFKYTYVCHFPYEMLAMSSSHSSLTVDSCICGYHEYSTIWEPVMGEELQCGMEINNLHDSYAVSVQAETDCGTCPS